MSKPEASHTPGPWVWRWKSGSLHRAGTPPYAYGDTVLSWDAEDGAKVSDADDALIAAAPDLLDALKDMAAGWRYIREHHGDLYGVGWDRAQQAAEAAIAKAEGTQQ